MYRLTKSGRFTSMNNRWFMEHLVKAYLKNVVCFHMVLGMIMSNKEMMHLSQFWESLHEAMGTKSCVALLFILQLMDRLSLLIRP